MCNQLRDIYAAYFHGENILHKIENVNLQKKIDKTVYRRIEWLQDIIEMCISHEKITSTATLRTPHIKVEITVESDMQTLKITTWELI